MPSSTSYRKALCLFGLSVFQGRKKIIAMTQYYENNYRNNTKMLVLLGLGHIKNTTDRKKVLDTSVSTCYNLFRVEGRAGAGNGPHKRERESWKNTTVGQIGKRGMLIYG